MAEREDARADPREDWDGKREESRESSSTATGAASSLYSEGELSLKELGSSGLRGITLMVTPHQGSSLAAEEASSPSI